MKTLRHPAVALIIVAMVVGLFAGGYGELMNAYDVPDDDPTSLNVMEQLNNLNILEGFSDIKDAFELLVSGSVFDILGALASGGIGILKTLLGVFTFAFEINSILSNVYDYPTIIGNGLLGMLYTYIAYLIVSSYTGSEK